ncbi:MAG TPA: hypothetical protein GXX24_09420 [Paracoccus solventivorans]|uniref:Uncharacterized protein n=1 Tax=Paracoccus solventivorans TaxID=53463 RepID=A0A832PNN1_9RHOB|nr:hypothetical protein [Paracoccus solventivorans]HHW34340.1 hypothetical protein [Paracoccus solventivorans]
MGKDSQHREADNEHNPQRALWQAVLMQAAEDAIYGASLSAASKTRQHRIAATKAARAWLTTPSRDLAEVCHLAGLEPQAVMEHMRKQIAQAPTPEELVSRRKPPKPKPAPKPPKPKAPTHYTLGDETLTVEQWAERAGIAPATIQSRLSKGWPLAKALTSRRGQHLSPARTWRRGSPPVTITHAGMTLTVQQWAERTGLSIHTIKARRWKGWPTERVLSPLVRRRVGKTQEAEAA